LADSFLTKVTAAVNEKPLTPYPQQAVIIPTNILC
jgi:hypothetical protein